MTDDRMALVELIEQGADSDLVREMMAFAAERMMDLEIEARTSVVGSATPSSSLSTPGTGSRILSKIPTY